MTQHTIRALADRTERRIATALVRRILQGGHSISVWDGEATTLRDSRDVALIFDSMASTDSDQLTVRRADGERLGAIALIYGNGEDLISDWSWNCTVSGAEAAMALLCEEAG
jgi:hypothetical protein